MGAGAIVIAKSERVAPQPVMAHPIRFVQHFALGMVRLMALDQLKRVPPLIAGCLVLLKFLVSSSQHKRSKYLAFYAATGCAQFNCLTRLCRHFLIAPLGKEKIGVK